MYQGLYFESIPVNSLKIIRWVPCRIKQYNNIGTNKIKTQSTSPKNIKMKKWNYFLGGKPGVFSQCIRSMLAHPTPTSKIKKKGTGEVLKIVGYSFVLLLC